MKFTAEEAQFLRSLLDKYHARKAEGDTPTPTERLNQWARELKKQHDRAKTPKSPSGEDSSDGDRGKVAAK